MFNLSFTSTLILFAFLQFILALFLSKVFLGPRLPKIFHKYACRLLLFLFASYIISTICSISFGVRIILWFYLYSTLIAIILNTLLDGRNSPLLLATLLTIASLRIMLSLAIKAIFFSLGKFLACTQSGQRR